MGRRLAAILTADVVDYSRAMGIDEAGTLQRLKAHRRELLEPKATQYGGRIIKLMGDGMLMEFASVVDAVAYAVDVQLAMRERNAVLPEEKQLLFRVGINVGDVISDGDDIYGDGVNIAARLEGLADPGGICVRRNVRNQVRDKLPLDFKDLGEIEVKNIERPIRVFSIDLNDKARHLAYNGNPKPLSRLTKKHLAFALVAGGLLLASGVFWWSTSRPEFTPPSVEPLTVELPVLAVLPFTNMSGDEGQDYVSDGITADLINDFSRISGLMVIARNTMFTYKNAAVSVRQVGQELDADHVLEGSVRKIGDRVRVNVQLIEAKSERELWAHRFDREIADIFVLQDEITSQIVSTLSVRLTGEERGKLREAQSANPEAYDLLWRALARYRRYTREANEEARALAQRALAVDPEFARAYVVLALTHYQDVLFSWKPVEMASALAEKAAEEALNLDNDLPQVHFALADVHRIHGRHGEAIAAAKRAVELDPGYADGYAVLGLTLIYSGEPEEGLRATLRAIQLNPRYPFFYVQNVGHAQYLMGNYESAVASFEEVVDRNPEFLLGHVMLAASYAQLGRDEDAAWEINEVMLLQPEFSLKQERSSSQYRRKEDLEHYLEGLQSAGLGN